jgi:hypothetical protein
MTGLVWSTGFRRNEPPAGLQHTISGLLSAPPAQLCRNASDTMLEKLGTLEVVARGCPALTVAEVVPVTVGAGAGLAITEPPTDTVCGEL